MTDSTTKYEIMAIIVNSLDEKKAQEQIKESIINRIKEIGGAITFEDFWGARGFAYMIKKEKWGYYFVAQFEVDGSKLVEFRKELNIDSMVVRFLISKVDPKAPAPRKYADIKKEWEATEKERKLSDEIDTPKKKAIVKKAPKIAEPKEIEKKTEEKPIKKEEKVEPAKKEAEVAKKDGIDKKLDKILEDSSLDL